MSGISAWVLSIAGVAVLTVLVDLVLPDGQTSKYIKGIFSFVMILIIIYPLPKLVGENFNFSDIFQNEDMGIQDDFIYQINRDKLDALENLVISELKHKGIEGVEVSLSANIFDMQMEIETVFVDLYHLVLNGNNGNINTKVEIRKAVKKFITIEEEKIIFNE